MALKHTHPGADFSALGRGRRDKIISAPRTGLVGEFQFGRNAATSKVNLVNQASAVWTGGATHGVRTADLNQTNWLDTGLPDTNDITMIWAGQLATLAAHNMFGNYSAATVNTNAIFLGITGTNLTMFTLNSDASLEFANVAGNFAGATDFCVVAGRASSGSGYVQKVDVFKAGARLGGVSRTATGKTRALSTRTIGVGGRGDAYSQSATAHVYGAAIYNTLLTDAELLAAVQDITAIAAARTGGHAITL